VIPASVLIAPVAPALFAVNDSGLAVAYVTRVTSVGASAKKPIYTLESTFRFDVTSGQMYLILFGTAFATARDSKHHRGPK
jgi:hypothetical protein